MEIVTAVMMGKINIRPSVRFVDIENYSHNVMGNVCDELKRNSSFVWFRTHETK